MLNFILISLVITLCIAIGLILSDPATPLKPGKGLNFDAYLGTQNADDVPLEMQKMRDGYDMAVRRFDGPTGAPLLVLVHGSGWHGMHFLGLAKRLSAKATVLVPDLRGHGAHPGTRGDIAYLGQFEDDLFDLIQANRTNGQKVILGGHSSGGGLVVRFAGGAHGGVLDGAVLLAPFLKHNAPTTRADSGGWAQVHLRRLIGLSMLNTFRIRVLNHLTVIQFRMPPQVVNGPLGQTATTAYSYRLNTSFAPRGNYLGDVAALPPFALIAGAQDEAFFADKYKQTMTPATSGGTYTIVPGVDHLRIVDAPETAAAIEDFLDEL